MAEKSKTAISPTREENFAEWYQQVIKAAELAENSDVRGCMVIKPWGYGIWELLQAELDRRIKDTGHENAYFPLFIPLSYIQKEADHIEGFAKECAVVTHHRLKEKDGALVPDGELEEPLIVRPTSETIIGATFAKWVESYRDLPLLINQWANVVRWEMRTRIFLRTAEFLWQEGHTAHATSEEAQAEVKQMLEVYHEVAEQVMAMPVIPGLKSPDETFPGAEQTFTIEAMMQDGKALQAGTSHYMGQNFSTTSGIKFLDQAGQEQYAYTTSWGVSTRLLGGLVMTHSDDDGLRIPPRLAPKQVVILPVLPKDEFKDQVFNYVDQLASDLKASGFRVHIDKRDLRGGEKNWQWIKKGAPIRIEVGPRDIEKEQVVLYRRDRSAREKDFLSITELKASLADTLDAMQENYLQAARDYQAEKTQTVEDFEQLEKYFKTQTGFVRAKWSGDLSQLDKLKELKLSIRCIPQEQSETLGKCILTGKEASQDIIIAKVY